MYNRQPCVTDDSFQLSYEHLRQLECAGHFRPSTEVPSFKFVSGKQQVADGEQECFDSGADMGFRMRTDDISGVFTASVLDCALNPSLSFESSLGTAAIENGKRPCSHFCDETVNKRARQEDQAAEREHFDGNSFISIPSHGKHLEEADWTSVDANVKSFEAGNLTFPWFNIKHRRNGYQGLIKLPDSHLHSGCQFDHRITRSDSLEDIFFQFSDHSHWRNVPIGPDHQAELPTFTSQHSNVALNNHDESSDKWLGTVVRPMLDHDSLAMEPRIHCSKIVCDCDDKGSIECVRKHVMEAREKLIRALEQEEFIQLGFSQMGETVAQRWTEEEENLFHEVVLSNPESAGRNFWVMLRKAFPSSSFKELVSYYFNVFVLRKRAHQNRFDRSNVDSDDDEWRESSDMEFANEGEEEAKSASESLPAEKIPSLENDLSEFECEGRHVGAEEDEGCRVLQTMDRNSADSIADYDHNDGYDDSKPSKISNEKGSS